MGKRLEAAAAAILDANGVDIEWRTESVWHGARGAAEGVLAAADAVMFSDAAVERVARCIFLAAIDLAYEEDNWETMGELSKEGWLNDARAVIAVLKGAGDE